MVKHKTDHINYSLRYAGFQKYYWQQLAVPVEKRDCDQCTRQDTHTDVLSTISKMLYAKGFQVVY